MLILLGLRWLPKRNEAVDARQPARVRARARAGARAISLLAGSAGTGLALLSYALMTRPFPQSISPYFLSRALPEGGGTNVVNVMLVDFRGLDTLGEITVLGVVALTVYALLRRFRPARESMVLPPQQQAVPADLAQRPDQLAQRRRHGARLPAGAGRAGAPAAADRDGDRGLPLHARPQRAGRWFRRRAGDVHRASSCSTSCRARSGSKPTCRCARNAGSPGACCIATATGWASLLLRLSVPDHAHRAPAAAAARRAAPGQRAVLRHRRVHAGGRRRAADPDRAGAPVGARPPPRRAHAAPLDVAPTEVPGSSAPVAEPR